MRKQQHTIQMGVLATMVGAGAFTFAVDAGQAAEITLQGPDVTKDTRVRASFNDDTNYGALPFFSVRERDQATAEAGLLEFDLDEHMGQSVQDVRIELYYFEQNTVTGNPAEVALRPLKHSWVEGNSDDVGATANHRDAPHGDLPWSGGNIRAGYEASDPDSVAETDNFGERLARATVDGQVGRWITWESQELDDYINEVLSGSVDYHGFIVETGMYQWGDNTEFRFYSSNFGDEPELQPKMTFVPEPASLAWLALGGLAALARRNRR